MPRRDHWVRISKNEVSETFDDMVVGAVDVKGGGIPGRVEGSIYNTDNTSNVGPDKLREIYIVNEKSTSNFSAAEDPTGREDGEHRSRSKVLRCELFVMAMIPPTQLPKPYLSEAFRLYEEHNYTSKEEMLSLLKRNSRYSKCIANHWQSLQLGLRRAQGSDWIIKKYPLEHREGLEHMGDGDIEGGCTVSQGEGISRQQSSTTAH